MDVLQTLTDMGGVLTDHHFVYKAGDHGPHYINIDPAFPDTGLMSEICRQLGLPFWPKHGEVDTVVGAATGAIPLAALTARSGGDGQHWPYPNYAWADKVGDDFVFERAGFVEQLAGKRVLVVEDILNTGDTVKKVIAQARAHGADVVGVSAICNRGNETAESLGVPRLEALVTVDFQKFPALNCPLCEDGQPIVADPGLGHGDRFRQEHPDYWGGYIKLLSS